MDANAPLIVGAGPVGLAAALFLARQGIFARLVDQLDEPAQQSKALAVNPRTLEILEPTGVTEQMLAIGKQIRAAHLHRRGKVVAEVSFDNLPGKYPFMLALSQATTERLLTRALEKVGGQVERGMKMTDCKTGADHATATLENTHDGSRETVQAAPLLAADGAHSVARRSLEIPFDGSGFANPWTLADVPMDDGLDENFAHVFFVESGGFIFALRVIDESSAAPGAAKLWRILGNMPDVIHQLPQGKPVGPSVWESSFHIAHRINRTLQSGHVYFAGDAAHLHSPMGARGMNLGIEDAWVFSELVRTKQLSRYRDLRRPVDRSVVKRIAIASRIVRGESPSARLVRNFMPHLLKIPAIRRTMLFMMTGLDHPLPKF